MLNIIAHFVSLCSTKIQTATGINYSNNPTAMGSSTLQTFKQFEEVGFAYPALPLLQDIAL